MNIELNLTNTKEITNISQAIKVIATTFKDVNFNVLFNEKLPHTFFETSNLKINNVSFNYDILFTNNTKELVDLDKSLAIKLLKGKENTVYLANLNKNDLTKEDIYQIFKESLLSFKDFTYALINYFDANSLSFIENHKEDPLFKGEIKIEDIANISPNLVIGSYEVTNTFISSLLYMINFLNKKNEKKKKESYFSKMFTNFGGGNAPKEESIIYLLEETTYYIYKNNKLIFTFDEDKSYNSYFYLLSRIIEVTKR